MRLSKRLLVAFPAFFCLAGACSNAHAAFTALGDIDPTTDPIGWTNSTNAYIGKTSAGTLTVDSGSNLLSAFSYIGFNLGSTGIVTVNGAGSKWTTDTAYIHVGYFGSGMLHIANGAAVSDGYGYVGFASGSLGTASVNGAGSNWTNSTTSKSEGPAAER